MTRTIAALSSTLLLACPSSHDGPAGDGGIACSRVVDEMRAAVEASKACAVDADCRRVDATCLPCADQEACGAVYVNGELDERRWETLSERAAECGVAGDGERCSGCCLLLPRPAVCRDSRCAEE